MLVETQQISFLSSTVDEQGYPSHSLFNRLIFVGIVRHIKLRGVTGEKDDLKIIFPGYC